MLKLGRFEGDSVDFLYGWIITLKHARKVYFKTGR